MADLQTMNDNLALELLVAIEGKIAAFHVEVNAAINAQAEVNATTATAPDTDETNTTAVAQSGANTAPATSTGADATSNPSVNVAHAVANDADQVDNDIESNSGSPYRNYDGVQY